jgi:phage terminase large subunit-like protein
MSQTPDEINYKQQRVNYKLGQIDREVVEALKELLDLLKTLASDRTSSLISLKTRATGF